MLGHLITALLEAAAPSSIEGVAASVSAVLVAIVLVSFALSGALKLGRVDEMLESFAALRVTPVLRRRMIAAAVPAAELVLALGLLLAPAPLFSVVCAVSAALSAYYLVLVTRVIVRHEQADCRCFGSLSQSRVTNWSVARNAALLAAVLFVLFTTRSGLLLTLGSFTSSMTIGFLTALLVLLSALLTGAAVRLSRLPRLDSRRGAADDGSRFRGSAPFDGTPWSVPDIEVTTVEGDVIPLAAIALSRPTLVFALSAECTPCREIVAAIPGWRAELGGAVDVVIVTSESRGVAERVFGQLEVAMYFGSRALLTVTGIAGMPSALLLTPDRLVAAGPAEGLDEVVAMTSAIVEATQLGGRRPGIEQPGMQQPGMQHPGMQQPSIQPRL